MWGVAGVLVVGCLIGFVEIPYLIKNKLTRELSFFSVILIIGVAVCVFQILHIPLPNPLDWITAIHKPISEYVLGMFE